MSLSQGREGNLEQYRSGDGRGVTLVGQHQSITWLGGAFEVFACGHLYRFRVFVWPPGRFDKDR